MKREELAQLGLSPDTADAVMALYGKSVEKHKVAAESWQEKHTQDTALLQLQLEQQQSQQAVQNAVQALQFTSESAKKAFASDLQNANLPVQNGALEGLDAFAAQYRKADPTAFVCENADKLPVFSMPTGSPVLNVPQSALRSAFGL